MSARALSVPLFGFLALFFGLISVDADELPSIRFNRDIRPILSDKCFACHGFDSKKRKAGLRLDLGSDAFRPAKSGKVAIRPGDLAGSEMWKRILSRDPDEVMPPPDTHKTLAESERALLRRWIQSGAAYQKHWAFEPLAKPEPPSLERSRLAKNPIDSFIVARLEPEHWSLTPTADRSTLIRRLSFDLRGLPPTPKEVDEFAADRHSDADDRLVQRFLDSPHYGERMASLWLDVARYADTHGMHLDNERSMWPYRDWVVSSFNRNQPFDQFTIDQIAGDLVPNGTREQVVATGFNRCNVTTGEGGSIDAELIFRYAVDRTATTVQAWMGLTAGCAVCHDHKFDPISAREFYSLYAFFQSNADPAMDGNVLLTAPFLKLTTPRDDQRLKELDADIVRVEMQMNHKLQEVVYKDPSEESPRPEARAVENIWAEDAFPSGGKLTAAGAPLRWVTDEDGFVFSGKRAIRRQEPGLGQDVFESAGSAFEIPDRAKLFASVYLDPTNAPKSVMLQYFMGSWEHRAVWGDEDAIAWGTKGSASRLSMGALPKTGEWVRLELDAEKVGLKTGDKVTGFALTQFGGTVFWDRVGVQGTNDPVNDPSRSFIAWQRLHEGKSPSELPDTLRKLFKETSVTNRTSEQVKLLREYFVSRVHAESRPVFEPMQAEAASLTKQRKEYENEIPGTFVFRDLEKPRDSFVMIRGQYDKPGEKVMRGVPAALPPLKNTNNPTRLDLAQWLVSPEHPLVARVTVNRFWQQFFGVGLVKTSDNFGSQGEPPSHPELLDWLAASFRDSGWNVKELVRLMVSSATYRQSSRVTPEQLQRDPENRLLARGSRFRLDAEEIRDNALYVSGLMDLKMGGRGVRPYQPPNIWEPVAYVGSNTGEYKPDTGPALYRRSLYTFYKRTAPPPFMSSFDAPNREQFCTRRERSDTPLQALQLLNDTQHFEAARALGQRMMIEGGAKASDRLNFGCRVVLGRRPSSPELAIVQRAFQEHSARYRLDPDAARKVVAVGESKARADLDPVELASYTLVANLLLNLDETITRN